VFDGVVFPAASWHSLAEITVQGDGDHRHEGRCHMSEADPLAEALHEIVHGLLMFLKKRFLRSLVNAGRPLRSR